MNLARSLTLVSGVIVGTLFIADPAVAWQEKDSDQPSQATQLMKQIRSSIEAGNCQDVADSMTDEAWDRWSAQLVVECLSMASMELGIALPELDESRERIMEALEKHGLHEIEIQRPSIEIRSDHDFSEDEEASDDAAEAEAQRDAQEKEILEQLGDGMKRMEIVADLWEAKCSSPLSVSSFIGKIEEEIPSAGGVIIKVAPAQPDPPAENGVTIMIAIPPVYLVLEENDGQLKYAGVDQEKTDQAREDFQPQMPDSAETDF